jgi:hypothetical protein
MFGDPEFFDIRTSKQMGMWPGPNQMSIGINPYINRMKESKPSVLLYGVLKGDDIIDILEKTNAVIFTYEKFKDQDEKATLYNTTLKNNLKDHEELCKNRINAVTDLSRYMKYFDVVLVNMDECLEFDLKLAYDTAKTKGIFGGNLHDTVRVKDILNKFRRENRIGTPISIAHKSIWFWYKR